MLLKKGLGQKTISSNISEMMKSPTFAEGKSKKKKHYFGSYASLGYGERSARKNNRQVRFRAMGIPGDRAARNKPSPLLSKSIQN